MTKTTIQIDEATKTDLDARKRAPGESYDSVVARLVAEHGTDDELTEARVRDIAREEIDATVRPRALK